MIRSVSRIVFPFALAVALALWINGYDEVGDGFSAGGFAGLAAVLQYISQDHEPAARLVGARWAWRFLLGGLALSLAVLLGPTVFGLLPVTHFPAPGADVPRFGALKLHTALAFDAGVALVVYGAIVGTFDRLFAPEVDSR